MILQPALPKKWRNYIMRISKEMYEEVAERCSAYDYDCKDQKNGQYKNSYPSKSCLNCIHFSDEEYCRLDLYDPIAHNLNRES